jgi:hypothetical protein
MSHPSTKTASNILAALAVALVFLSANSVLAQGRNIPPLMSEREHMQYENAQRLGPPVMDLRTWSDGARARAARLARQAEIKTDAERLQFFNGEMMRSASTGMALDPERILQAASEIKKRAARLRLNLGLPKIKKEETRAQGQAEMDEKALAASLLKLDGLIKSLSANPLLGNRNIIDAGQAASAVEELADIIILSDQIRKSAKRWKQATRPAS